MRLFKCISRLMTWRFTACLLPLLFCAQGVSAANYYWVANSGPDTHFPSAVSVCEYWFQVSLGNNVLVKLPIKTTIASSGKTVTCTATFGSNANWGIGYGTRLGDACAPGSTYVPATGECKAPDLDKCEPTVGVVKTHEVNRGKIGATSGAGDPPGSICENQCQFAWDGSVPVSCYRFVDGTRIDDAFCSFRYKGNGVQCTGGDTSNPGSVFDQPPIKPPSSTEPTKMSDQKCESWVTGADGTRSKKCTSTDSATDPGKMNCPTGQSGTLVCSSSTPPPYKNDVTTETTTTESTGVDGSGNKTTTTTTTTTTCKGTSPCTTSTKTETKGEGTDANGNPTGTSTTCTGYGCDKPEDEQPKEAECDPATSEDGCAKGEASVVRGEACDDAISCKGDAVQCAILRQQKTQQCADEEFRKVTPEKITDLKNALDSEFEGDQYQPLTADSENTFDFTRAISTTSHFGKSCPALPDISFSGIGGGTIRVPMNALSGDLCNFFTWIGYLVVAFAMRRGAEIIAEGMN